MKKVIKILIWILIVAWFFIVMGFIGTEEEGIICNQIEISMMDSAGNRFISKAAIRELLNNTDLGLQGYPVSGINTRDLEFMLESNPYIKNAEIYFDITGRLNIEITQRDALLRIMPNGEKGFYIDEEGHFLPLSAHYSAWLLLATGNTDYPEPTIKKIGDLTEAEMNRYQYLTELYDFAKYISKHPLWSSQIVQIYVNRDGEYEIIPRVGAHQIMLGPMKDYRQKLRNLEMLYEQGLSKYGWNSYDKINIKYLNQVICTKR